MNSEASSHEITEESSQVPIHSLDLDLVLNLDLVQEEEEEPVGMKINHFQGWFCVSTNRRHQGFHHQHPFISVFFVAWFLRPPSSPAAGAFEAHQALKGFQQHHLLQPPPTSNGSSLHRGDANSSINSRSNLGG